MVSVFGESDTTSEEAEATSPKRQLACLVSVYEFYTW